MYCGEIRSINDMGKCCLPVRAPPRRIARNMIGAQTLHRSGWRCWTEWGGGWRRLRLAVCMHVSGGDFDDLPSSLIDSSQNFLVVSRFGPFTTPLTLIGLAYSAAIWAVCQEKPYHLVPPSLRKRAPGRMRFLISTPFLRPRSVSPLPPLLPRLLFSMATPLSLATSDSGENPDDGLCSVLDDYPLSDFPPTLPAVAEEFPCRPLSGEWRVEQAWAHWRRLGSPKLLVAPMVDNSELPFRMLCRKYGAEAAYTPMLHSRIFSENEKYRRMEFTTCKEDRPLFVQFCANDPETLLEAVRFVEPYCDYVDINLGCPQRIARRGNYGAFLMDNLPLIKSLVEKLALNLRVPVSCKIRIFPLLEDTIAYAKMLEEAGCALLAVHGRTRDEKDGKKFRANWSAIKAVKNALKIPVLANGNIRHMEDVYDCLHQTGVDGVLSAESLLENPALFAGYRTTEWGKNDDGAIEDGLDQVDLAVEYLKLCEQYPVPWRMVRSHVHKMLGDWFRIHPHVREELNKQSKLTFEWLHGMVNRLKEQDARIPLYVKSANGSEVTTTAAVEHAT